MGIHWDGTITLGNVLTFFLFGLALVNFWRAQDAARSAQAAAKKDLEWRIANLETWRKEHMIDSDARDALLKRLDTATGLLEYLVKERRRDNEAKRKPREGQY
jgi:hypothetical protein